MINGLEVMLLFLVDLNEKFPNINGLKLKLEYDPFNYLDFSAQNRSDAFIRLEKKIVILIWFKLFIKQTFDNRCILHKR